jgi:hypothetical protein
MQESTTCYSTEDVLGIKKLRGGEYWIPTRIARDGDRLNLHFPYSPDLLAEVKQMAGRRWNVDEKFWSVKDCERNRFALASLSKELADPYGWYDQDLVDVAFERSLYAHQREMARVGLTLRRVLLAAEQGLGKSLAAIEVMERSGFEDWFYVGPRSAIASFEVELINWGAKVTPSILTYERLQRMIDDWPPGRPVPMGVIFDESQRIKTPTSGRSVAAYRLAEAMRREYGDDAYVLLLSGTPAPKDPTDYWHQCEVACPGFLREGDLSKFEARLSLLKRVNGPGGTYPQRVTWFDDEAKCRECGMPEEDHSPELAILQGDDYHEFAPSTNEVAYLHERMKGLVWVYRKKDHLAELPELRYRTIRCQPSEAVLRAARLIAASSETAIQGFTRLRELSDGFQYTEEEVRREVCPKCKGTLTVEQAIPVVDEDALELAMQELYERAADGGIRVADDDGLPIPEHLLLPEHYEVMTVECWRCGGTGEVPVYARSADKIDTPKDRVLRELLEAHDDDGRLIVFAGFMESVERVVEVLEAERWSWIRFDGRGWKSSPDIKAKGSYELLRVFQKGQQQHPRVCFVGQADAAGTGLTLTASHELVFYSNTFNGDSRMQAEHRAHRPGMDVNKGCLITDIVHLPSDETTIQNLKEKKRLQDLSLGVLSEGLTE